MSDPKKVESLRLTDAQQNQVDTIFDQYNRDVFCMAYSMLRNAEDAEDMVSEVYIKIAEHVARHQPVNWEPKPWIIRVTCTSCIDRLRRKKSAARLADTVRQNEPDLFRTVDPILLSEVNQLREAIRSCGEKIPDPIDFLCLLMKVVEQYEWEEVVAEFEEISTISNARTRVTRAKRHMKACLESKGIGIDDSFIAE